MKNFEVQHTIRLYDPELIAEIGRTYEAHSKEFRNKNEFMTELLKLGVKAMNTFPPNASAGSAVPPAALLELTEAIGKVLEIDGEILELLKVKFKELSVHLDILKRLLSAIYNMQLGGISGQAPLPQKVADGFFDDLPLRFEKIIFSLEKKYGIK